MNECNSGLSSQSLRCVLEETVEVVRLAPHGQVQQRTAEQIVEVSQFLEETVEVVR